MRKFATGRRPKQKLLVFARLPQQGRVKTRLAADLGDERTVALYRAMIDDLLEGIGDSDEHVDLEIAWTAAGDVGGDDIRSAFGERHVFMQTGRDLGERLVVAFSERIVFQPTEKIVAIGVDDPALDREQILCAFHLLDSCEWVIGPAVDGGYYLIGCRAGAFHPSVFEKIEWGTPRVFEQTEDSIRALGATLAVLPRRLDLDGVRDLRRFATDGATGARRVLKLIRDWGMA
ncbi:MAG: TIGR04282 family arsenosugar biosynthesis glycosyltransferase [Thermoanaerobaculia bacterium]